MTKEDKQIIDRAVKEEWRIGDRTRLKRLLKKNLKLYRENVKLEQACNETQELLDKQIEATYKLDKENAELKELLNCNNCSELSEEECEVCAEYSHFKCKRKDLLTKAKDLLKKMYYLYFDPCVTHKDLENRDKLFEEVKQFIKE